MEILFSCIFLWPHRHGIIYHILILFLIHSFIKTKIYHQSPLHNHLHFSYGHLLLDVLVRHPHLLRLIPDFIFVLLLLEVSFVLGSAEELLGRCPFDQYFCTRTLNLLLKSKELASSSDFGSGNLEE